MKMRNISRKTYRTVRRESEGLWAMVVLPVLLIFAYVAIMASVPMEVATFMFLAALLAIVFVIGFIF